VRVVWVHHVWGRVRLVMVLVAGLQMFRGLAELAELEELPAELEVVAEQVLQPVEPVARAVAAKLLSSPGSRVKSKSKY